MRAARGVRQGILEAFPEGDYQLFVVWTNVLATDALAEARSSSAVLADRRATHYFDPQRVVGRALAPSTGLDSMADVLGRRGVDPALLEGTFQRGYLVGEASIYDTVFFFDAEATWAESPPAPVAWVTQLDPATYTGLAPERFFWNEALTAELKRLAAVHLRTPPADGDDPESRE